LGEVFCLSATGIFSFLFSCCAQEVKKRSKLKNIVIGFIVYFFFNQAMVG